ncbi:MFS transporter [Mucilaginibacter xinganensis]|uniref:Putative arabinose efflux permease, MFS family n=1 Tax=Mucilaginibacter xinganensis TaxID=1234841 RepID=A0A223NYE4_9SPHI|nr:MFS transporter [Mucilaginibacter xinganensis]ASU34897.1 putative arabinose efflux permease, MFS family [Mucilaginibacter xinganensis]
METLSINALQKPQLTSAKLAALFTICFVSSAFGGAVSTLMSVYLPVVVKEMQGDKSPEQLNYLSGSINSLFIFGWAIGGFLWGIISDRIGRKKALLLAVASYGVFTILTGFMTNWYGIMACRFFSGFGVGGDLVIAFTLLSEVWPQKSKAVYTGILSISFPVGIFSAGAINYFVTSWRQGFFIGAVPVLLALLGCWFINESAVWIKHKYEKLSLPAATQQLFSAQNRKALLIGSLIFGTMLIGLWAIFSWMPTWIQSLITGDAHKERGLSMMCLGMGGLTGGFFSGWLVNLMGLRRSLITSFTVCTIMAFVLFKTNLSFSVGIYAEIAVLALFFGASQGILSVYIPQLFPTAVRASATGICFNAGRLFTAAAVLFVGILVTTLGGYGNALFVFSLVFLLGLFVVLFARNIQPSDYQ